MFWLTKPSLDSVHIHSMKYVLQCLECYGQDLILHQDGGDVRYNIQ
jgi:hypothetical protein